MLDSKFYLIPAISLLFRAGGRAAGRPGAGYSKNTTNSAQLSWAGAWAELGKNTSLLWEREKSCSPLKPPRPPVHPSLSILLEEEFHTEGTLLLYSSILLLPGLRLEGKGRRSPSLSIYEDLTRSLGHLRYMILKMKTPTALCSTFLVWDGGNSSGSGQRTHFWSASATAPSWNLSGG